MKTVKLLSACLFLLPLVSCTQVQNKGGDAAIEQKVETLLSKMTLEEKLGQMNQISSYGNIEDMSGLIKKGEIGSILNEVDPVRVNALQRVAAVSYTHLKEAVTPVTRPHYTLCHNLN